MQRERELVQAQIAAIEAKSVADHRMSREEIRQMVDCLGGLLAILRSADPADKLETYRHLERAPCHRYGDHRIASRGTTDSGCSA